MSDSVFLKPRLVGDRFAGHAIPLEVLADLAVLKDLVLEVAKANWIADNPIRKRTPKGFFDGLDLRLTAVEDGSAIPVIMLMLTQATLVPLENQQYIEKARDSIVSAIAAAQGDGSNITTHLPEQTLSYFNRLGRNLQDDEAIEFPTGVPNAPARLTPETRKRLVLASRSAKEYSESHTLRGVIPEADQDKMTFTIQTRQGRRIPATITDVIADGVLTAFNGYRDGERVAITGIGCFNRSGILLRFESIHDIVPLDQRDIPSRLEELRDLQDGWLDGHGKAPSSQGLDWLGAQFTAHYQDGLPLPYCYPTEEGGVRAEWSLSGYECSLDIDFETQGGSWHALSADGAEEEHELALGEADAWRWLNERIAALQGGAA